RADGAEKLASFAHAAAGIDHRDRVVAHDESDIGDGAFVLARHQGDGADMDEDAGSDFGDGQGRLSRMGERRGRKRGKQRKTTYNSFARSHRIVTSEVPICVAAR